MVDRHIQAELETKLGSPIESLRAVSGGDINQAHALRLRDGRGVFVKTHPRALAGMFQAEAHGLGWLAQAGALRTPRVLAVSEDFLALELIESAPPNRNYDERLGRGLATLHRCGAPSFGLDRDNYLATLLQSNAPSKSWASFYAEQRLAPQLARAVQRGLATRAMRAGFEELLPRLSVVCGPAEPPARLHGDLWGGNALPDEGGEPVLIDPAVYGGHREVDLAMMKLFGGFGARCFAAYDEAYPLADGHEERVPLYQLYPLLVHVNLFGSGYSGAVESSLASLV